MRMTQLIIVILLWLLSFTTTLAQTINWKNLKKEEKHLLNATVGWEHGLVYGVAYGYKLKTKLPIVVDASFSIPSGETVFDDFKTKIGGQINVYQINNFHFNASLHGIYRRYENPLVTLQNFGADATVIIGYYKPKWFTAIELGFDKAIVTHFKHTEIYREVYPAVKDGWYEPSTGGNANYGIQGGYSFHRNDITLRLGKVISQDFKTEPMVPFYIQLGYNYKL
jgi:hypothetical protein